MIIIKGYVHGLRNKGRYKDVEDSCKTRQCVPIIERAYSVKSGYCCREKSYYSRSLYDLSFNEAINRSSGRVRAQGWLPPVG